MKIKNKIVEVGTMYWVDTDDGPIPMQAMLNKWVDKDCGCTDGAKIVHMIRYGVSEPKCKYCESGRKLANIMEALVAVSESGGVIRVDSVNEDIVNEALKNNPVDALVLQRIYMELIGAYNSDMARERGIKRAELSDQHPAKQEVKKQWLSLTVGQKKYGYKAEFARSMVVKFPVLKSTKVIEGWCKDWELEAS